MKSHVDTSKMVFCFGSNEGGYHGGGAARFAYEKRGAIWGYSYGHYGQSFAIPTKAGNKVFGVLGTLPLGRIEDYVTGFLAYAAGHPELQFQVTCIGCGLAGLRHSDIAPMFKNATSNCWFDNKWLPWLGPTRSYWGEG